MDTGVGRHAAPDAGPEVCVAPGARAAEAALLAALDALDAAGRADPALLARPVRVVVPSRSLREHLAAERVRRAGRAVVGVRVQTLHGLAMEVLDAAGEPAPVGDPLFPVLVRRAARAEPALRAVLEDLEDGYASVAGEVADLLDAGWDPDVPGHAEALEAALAEERSADVAARAAAVARVAAAVAGELARLGCGRRGTRLARAAALLAADPERVLPSRAVLVHGFADATGVASDLLEALARGRGATFILDEPPDPAAPERPDPGARFSERLRERLGWVEIRRTGEAPAPPHVEALRAPGAHAEVRAVAERVRALLDAGARPERIGVVARHLDAYRVPVRVHFGRLGIPFSGLGAVGPPGATGRRLHALLDLLRHGPRTPAERWLEIVRPLSGQRRADLRLALHGEGVARLGDLAALDVEAVTRGEAYLALAARRGLAASEIDGKPRARARKRTVGRDVLEALAVRASEALAGLGAWPDPAPLPRHRAALELLVDDVLRWSPRRDERRALTERLDALERELPAAEPLSRDELVLLLARGLRDAGCEPLGGAGAGIPVLGVVEARARTFEHLFVLGTNRDVFPRPVLESPLLPDDLRERLRAVLPEMPVKRRGFEEEHYLFAQLVAASPEVVLCWQTVSDDGKGRSPSPLLERLRIAGRGALPESTAGSLQAPPRPGAPLTGPEAARLEGLYGTRESFAALLPGALRDRGDEEAPPPEAPDPETLARARCAVLAEHDPEGGRRRELGPYFGFVGAARLPADPRREPLYVTQVENLVRCPWRVFLRRMLAVEPPRDALDALPAVTPLLRGAVVHRALEHLVKGERKDLPRDLEACAGAPPLAVTWPQGAALDALLRRAAEMVLREEGLGPAAFARLLAADARRLVDAARTLEWPAPGPERGVVGVEVTGTAEVQDAEGHARPIHFRADRVDRRGGRLRLVDYKTGRKTVSDAVKEETRRAHLLAAVGAGTHLQAAAYAGGPQREGAYLFLYRPDRPGAVSAVPPDDAEVAQALAGALRTALAVLDAGAFFPRLTDAKGEKENRDCDWCEVRDACLQGDSGARLRLVEWMERGPGRDAAPAERAASALWRIGSAEGDEG